MITILNRGGLSRDPQKWLRNMCTTAYVGHLQFPNHSEDSEIKRLVSFSQVMYHRAVRYEKILKMLFLWISWRPLLSSTKHFLNKDSCTFEVECIKSGGHFKNHLHTHIVPKKPQKLCYQPQKGCGIYIYRPSVDTRLNAFRFIHMGRGADCFGHCRGCVCHFSPMLFC